MILVHELTKVFETGGGGEVVAVDHLSFQVNEGEVFGLLGANGAGKTTTLRMILGLVTPTSGYTEVNGFRTLQYPEEVKCRVGLVSTSAGLYQWLTPRELLLFFADLYGLDDARANKQLEMLVELFRLNDFIDRRCGNLSTGQKQRVNLARSLIHDPPVVLLDEPTRGLDVIGCRTVFDYINVVRHQGRSVILCTHRVDESERICDRFGLMHQGRFAYQGTLDQLKQSTGCDGLADIFLNILGKEQEMAEDAL